MHIYSLIDSAYVLHFDLQTIGHFFLASITMGKYDVISKCHNCSQLSEYCLPEYRNRILELSFVRETGEKKSYRSSFRAPTCCFKSCCLCSLRIRPLELELCIKMIVSIIFEGKQRNKIGEAEDKSKKTIKVKIWFIKL